MNQTNLTMGRKPKEHFRFSLLQSSCLRLFPRCAGCGQVADGRDDLRPPLRSNCPKCLSRRGCSLARGVEKTHQHRRGFEPITRFASHKVVGELPSWSCSSFSSSFCEQTEATPMNETGRTSVYKGVSRYSLQYYRKYQLECLFRTLRHNITMNNLRFSKSSQPRQCKMELIIITTKLEYHMKSQ